ncbi:MAG: crotonase [Gammaproteobacteria bacterium]|nr:crotonase [Gammaproteobacteria bacterium]
MNTDTPAIRNWTLETDAQDIAWLGLRTDGSANVLSQQVVLELGTVLEAMHQAPPAGVVIYSHKDSGFIAGADVTEFPSMQSQDEVVTKIEAGYRILERLEALPCASVAVLNGTTLGGGLELALACSWRLSFDGDKPVFGLPEVQLGLHPGLGGTIRTPELVGVRAAMELMLKGRSIKPRKALKIGLIDELTSPDQWRMDAARLAVKSPPSRSAPLLDRLMSLPGVRSVVAGQLHRQVAAKLNPDHYPAPFAMIDLWKRTGATRDSFSAEARSFAKLMFGSTAKNLIRVFFLQDRLKSLAKASDRDFSHVHVVGAGTMGADIAAWCAMKNISVTLQDREKQYVDAGIEKARRSMEQRYRGNEERVQEAMQRLVGDHTGEGARSADIVIEAIFEDLEAKQALFADLERRARPDCLLASNTSSIPLEQIAEKLQQPARLVGLHFFNPVAKMPLVEVVRGDNSGAQELAEATAFGKQIGKLPLPCKGLPGFLVNRVLAPYMDEAFLLHQEGCQAEAIDQAAVDFGMPVGPMELADRVGIDILMHVGEIVADTIGRQPAAGIAEMVDEGRLGEKSGAGFYVWDDGKPRKDKVNRPLSQEARDRLILAFVNEAAASVGAGVVDDADLADAGMIFGAGFAPFHGGPLQYARDTGIDAVRKRLAELSDEHGARFSPATGWDQVQK